MTPTAPSDACNAPLNGRTTARRTRQRLSAAFSAEPELISACLEGADGEAAQQAQSIFSAAEIAQAGQPTYADLSYHAARAALAASRYAAAARLVAQALRVNPAYDDARVLAARVELHFGCAHDARRHVEAVLASGADYPDVHALLGRACQQERDWEGARRAYARALALNPALAEIRAALAALPAHEGRESHELPA
jgi:tetratricopeptide (TPR) repeat protein